MSRWPAVLVAVALVAGAEAHARQDQPKGVLLERLTWVEAEARLTSDALVVIPLGAAAREHGPHLPLRTDGILAAYLIRRVLDRADVVVAPALAYDFAPDYLEYPGSASLRLDTARDLFVDVVRSLAAHGPRRFYVLAAEVADDRPLRSAAALLADDGIFLRYADPRRITDAAARQVRQEPGGTHADEVETSALLYVDPGSVDMTKAARDFGAGDGPLTRAKGGRGRYSPSGVWGDATLATPQKGQAVVEALVAGVLQEIEETRVAPLPAARPARAPAIVPRPGERPPDVAPPGLEPTGTAGDERALRDLMNQFQTAWANLDSWGVASLWTEDGYVVHADGFVERGQQAILEGRANMFARREYRASQHLLYLGEITFVGTNVAVATGHWSLFGVHDEAGRTTAQASGACALAFRKVPGEGWRFLALQYAARAHDAPPPLTRVPNAVVR